MRRKAVVAACAVASVLPPAHAAASREDRRIQKIVQAYATCVVKARHDRAASAILANENNFALSKHYGDLMDSECMGQAAGGGGVAFAGDSFRYALADALVTADYAESGPAGFDDRLPLAQPEMPDAAARDAAIASAKDARHRRAAEDSYSRGYAIATLSRYGECIVRRNAVDARMWMLTAADVPEEISRINALRPAFADCLADGTIKFDRMTMRGLVAINYYRLAKATPQPRRSKVN